MAYTHRAGRLGKPLRGDRLRRSIIVAPPFKMHGLPAGYLLIVPCKGLLVACFPNGVPGSPRY